MYVRIRTLLLDGNLFDEIPPFLCLVSGLQNVTFRDNIIRFPDQSVLDLGWSGIKIHLQNILNILSASYEQRLSDDIVNKLKSRRIHPKRQSIKAKVSIVTDKILEEEGSSSEDEEYEKPKFERKKKKQDKKFKKMSKAIVNARRIYQNKRKNFLKSKYSRNLGFIYNFRKPSVMNEVETKTNDNDLKPTIDIIASTTAIGKIS